MSSGKSSFIAGLLVGVLVATAGFAWLRRMGPVGGETAADAVVLKLGHTQDVNHPVHQALVEMDRLLRQ